jgi:hypothetical protein
MKASIKQSQLAESSELFKTCIDFDFEEFKENDRPAALTEDEDDEDIETQFVDACE